MTEEAATHAADHDSPEYIRAHLKVYYMIFGSLLVLTGVTVAVSYLEVSIGWAVFIAMLVASIKGSLVAAYFMHLIDDKKFIAITWPLIITGVLFLFCLLIPVLADVDYVSLG